MTSAFWQGLGPGLATALLVGPVFFTLLKASLDHGFKGGVLVALGIIISDIAVVYICMAGFADALYRIVPEFILAISAGLILLTLGGKYIALRVPERKAHVPLRRTDALSLFTTGFVVNFVNPFVFAIWIGLVLHTTHAHGDRAKFAYLIGVLCGILGTDLAKAYFAPKLKQFLTVRTWRIIYRAIGFAMVVFSLRLFWYAYQHSA